MKLYSTRLNDLLLRLETKLSLKLTALLLGLILFAVTMLYVSPKFEPVYHGKVFSEMSSSPFDFAKSYPLQNRILAPLLGYLLFLRGDLFFMLPLAFAVFVLSALYYFTRKQSFSPFESLLVTALLSFSSLVFLPLISPGYTDAVTFFFLLLAFVFAPNSMFKSSLFFSLALLNHESCLFLLPSLFLYRLSFNENWFKTAFYYLVALLPVLGYRYFVSLNMEAEYSIEFYFSQSNLNTCMQAWHFVPAGVFYAFKLLWFFPLYILIESYKRGEKLFFFCIAAALIFPLFQYVIAYDITRMICIAFPAVLLSIFKLREYWGAQKFTSFSKYLFLFNLILLPAMAFKEGIFPLLPFWLEYVIQFVQQSI